MLYAPLHVHTDASLDGAGTVESLVAEAKRLGLEHLAMTDHGTLANAVAFWSACTDAEIKPILGMEAYLLYEGRRHHITLLSMSEMGFNNLISLDSWSHEHNHGGGYPLITLEALDERHHDLFALTGCASSAMYHGEFDDGLLYTGRLHEIFGDENMALEVMFIGSHNTYSRPYEIQKMFPNLGHVITNDTHYPCRNQHPAHQTIVSARRGFTYDSAHLWLKSADEILHEGMKYAEDHWIVQGFFRTLWIAERAEAWNMRSAPTLPHTEGSVDMLRATLLRAVYEDADTKGHPGLRAKRLQYEWNILKTQGFLDYIYILWDIVSWAKGEGIRVGPGRGSGAGSYVLYLLGVTGIDPIEHGLLFERFINPSRADYPDVDVDFEADRRQEVINYASEMWGTVPIATYSTYSHKSAVHDIARVLGIPKDLEIPAAEGASDSVAFETFLADKPEATVSYQTMLGQIRHRGKHAAGVIIPNRPVPIERAGDQLVAAWAEGANSKDLSKVGIVKFDLLGLTALSQLRRMEELTGKAAPKWTDDDAVFNLFCKGDVAGIFQWSGSEGIRELTMRIAPRNFHDLVACNALYRPGALDAGTAELYPDFMKAPRLLHPRIDRHLEDTYGVICYQEQVMAVVAEVMGGDLAQADIVRRLISKPQVGDLKWEAEIAGLYASFIMRGEAQGFAKELLEKIWYEIYTHSRYSFNLSHATAYTTISYQMAWYKVYHRPAFTVSVLQHDKANAQTYMLDAIEHGLEVMMPHVNHSTDEYQLVDDRIYIPLNDIAFLGEKGVLAILEERKRGGHFHSYEDFDKRLAKKACNNRARKIMEGIGAFDGLEGNPSSAIKDYGDIHIHPRYEAQLFTLGYVVPSPALWKKIRALSSLPARKGYTRFAGFISQIKKKKSSHGPYTVYNLSPSGSFWMRGIAKVNLQVGKLVSGTKSKFGHSNDVKVYKLTGE